MDESINRIFKKHFEMFCVEFKRASSGRIKGHFVQVMEEIAHLYSEIRNISIDEAVKILHESEANT